MTTSSIENTPILIQVGNKELKISTIYKRSGIPLLASDLDSLLNTSHYTIVVIAAGDLNTKHRSWNSIKPNTAGNTNLVFKHAHWTKFNLNTKNISLAPKKVNFRNIDQGVNELTAKITTFVNNNIVTSSKDLSRHLPKNVLN